MDYHFVSREAFRDLAQHGGFVEHAEYAGNLYGTSWAAIDGPLARGEDLLLEVEVQGAAQLRERRADARFVFLLPPPWRSWSAGSGGAARIRRTPWPGASPSCAASSRRYTASTTRW